MITEPCKCLCGGSTCRAYAEQDVGIPKWKSSAEVHLSLVYSSHRDEYCSSKLFHLCLLGESKCLLPWKKGMTNLTEMSGLVQVTLFLQTPPSLQQCKSHFLLHGFLNPLWASPWSPCNYHMTICSSLHSASTFPQLFAHLDFAIAERFWCTLSPKAFTNGRQLPDPLYPSANFLRNFVCLFARHSRCRLRIN